MKVRITSGTRITGLPKKYDIGAVVEVAVDDGARYLMSHDIFVVHYDWCEPVRGERDEVLDKLAGFEYPDWCEWVTADSYGTFWYLGGAYTLPFDRIDNTPFNIKDVKFHISEIRARQEKLSIATVTSCTYNQAENVTELVIVDSQFDWERPDFRATVMANVGHQEPRQYVCRPILDVINCGCGELFASPDALQKHLKGKTGETFPITLILEKFKK